MRLLTATLAGMSAALCVSQAGAEIFGGIDFPHGEASFVDLVVSYQPLHGGGPGPYNPDFMAPAEALGPPNYTGGAYGLGAVSLGHGGRITLRFADNYLTGSGDNSPDLNIFEAGTRVEDTLVEISKDGITWHEVGEVTGGTSSIDIDAYGFGIPDLFAFVRLSDDPTEGPSYGATVGADIDAVGAITSVDAFILTSIANGNWNAASTWSDGAKTPTEEYRAVVGSHTIAIMEDAEAKSLEITEPDGEIIIDSGAELLLTEGLTVPPYSRLGFGISGASVGEIICGGEVYLAGGFEAKLDDTNPFKAGTYTLITTVQTNGILGKFFTSNGLGDYVSQGEEQNGLEYGTRKVTLTIDKDLNPGDANLDTETDVRDFNVWNANKFTSDTQWTTGDFNNDGETDVRDFNVWNAHKFTSATAGAPLVEGQVPEPATIILLITGAIGLSVFRRMKSSISA